MVWCKNNKLIFIHIPKTGGTTIEKFFNLRKKINGYGDASGDFKGKSLQHLIGLDIRKILGEKVFNNFFKFTIVRNPIDRVISEYYWNTTRAGTSAGYGYQNNKCKTYNNC